MNIIGFRRKCFLYFLITGIILSFGFSLISGCKDASDEKFKELDIKTFISLDSNYNSCIIRNTSDKPIYLTLRLNDVFPIRIDDIKNWVENKSGRDSISLAEASWQYVIENTFSNPRLTEEIWQHNPLLFLNSVGGGMCDDLSSVLAAIWRYWYDSVRIVVIEGHVIAEVKNGERWEMYDPDEGVAYYNYKGEIASIEELERNPDLIQNPQKILGNILFAYPSMLTSKFANFYDTKSDNRDETQSHLSFSKYDTLFVLPAQSDLRIGYDNNRMFLTVTLRKQSVGELRIPLVPYNATGSFVFNNGGEKYHVKDEFNFETKRFMGNMAVLKVNEVSEINYLLNPKANFWRKKNFLELSSSDSVKILLEYNSHYKGVDFGKVGLVLDSMKSQIQEYKQFIKRLSKLESQDINENTIENLFYEFIVQNNMFNENLFKEEHRLMKDRFLYVYKDSVSRKQFIEDVPKSISLLFISTKYNSFEQLNLADILTSK